MLCFRCDSAVELDHLWARQETIHRFRQNGQGVADRSGWQGFEAKIASHLLALARHRSRKERALVAKVIVNRDLRYARIRRNLFDRGRRKSCVEKAITGGGNNRLAFGDVGWAAQLLFLIHIRHGWEPFENYSVDKLNGGVHLNGVVQYCRFSLVLQPLPSNSLSTPSPHSPHQGLSPMLWIAIRMLTGDKQKFYGLLFGIAFSTLLITQQLTIFVNLVERGASGVYNAPEAEIWVMDPVSRTTDVKYEMPATALDEVRSVRGVEWAVPHLRANASVRSSTGDLEGVAIIGVDDATLIGLPRNMLQGSKNSLSSPDTVIIDDLGVVNMFEDGTEPLGQRLELNDQRAVIRGVADSIPSFTSQVTLYTKYTNALNYVPGTRNRLSFVLAGVSDGQDPATVAQRIQEQTGLKAQTRDEFARAGVDFIIQNTGIPTNFGITVILGFVVGVAIVGLTFSLFIRDNIKQFGALKAIGVTNAKIIRMVAAQAGLVGSVGYALGVVGTALFMYAFSGVPEFKGFYIPVAIPFISLVGVIVILALTGWTALRSVLSTEPASVFR